MNSPKTILIADDSESMLYLLKFNLAKLNCNIVTALSGEETVEKATSLPSVDLFIVDYMMTGINGLETIQALRKDSRYAAVPIIMITARGQGDIKPEAEKLGISAFLNKPFSPLELVKHVKRLLEEKAS